MHKNIVSNNLVEFVLGIEAVVKDNYSVVKESVDFQAGYFKAFAQKEEVVKHFHVEIEPVFFSTAEEAKEALGEQNLGTVPEVVFELPYEVAQAMIDNPGEPNEKLKEILEIDAPVSITPAKPSRRGKK